jgi:iron complex transport system substrate-binding protein
MITLTRRDAVALGLASALSVARCRDTSREKRTRGRRVVSVAPNVTEMLFALGLGGRVVGVSSLCDFPDEARQRTRVGALDSLSVEAILALAPDTVAGVPGVPQPVIDRLRARRIHVEISRVESVEDVRALARTYGRLFDEPAAVDRWLPLFDEQIARARHLFVPRERPRVLAVVDQRPLVCAGPGSYVDELLRLSNVDNALASGPAWPQLSLETVISVAPDVVLDLCGPLAQEPLDRAWAAHTTIPAVRDRRVVSVADPLVTRPGPRAPRAIELVSLALQRTTR